MRKPMFRAFSGRRVSSLHLPPPRRALSAACKKEYKSVWKRLSAREGMNLLFSDWRIRQKSGSSPNSKQFPGELSEHLARETGSLSSFLVQWILNFFLHISTSVECALLSECILKEWGLLIAVRHGWDHLASQDALMSRHRILASWSRLAVV